ncbi:uncharacterized protein LOC124891524, partial [Capsicum annuum]|uniref:uncharacterized protein LOC124891524 n=1 Tax=Capsicum annuum TaxID=4072 RepID=UPI001FB134DA
MSSELIASLCVNHFRDSKGPSIIEIQRIVFKELHCHASYWMCWKGSVIAKNIIHGTMEHGYTCLSIFSHMAELLNPGSSYSIMDTKNHIFSIVFCVVDKENDASWTFFFQKLKSIVEDEPYLCVISDRHISIANAFCRVYSCAHHGLCTRHLAEKLHVNQHCGEHLYLFYAAEKAYSFDKFSENFEELKYNCPEAAHVLENVLGFEKLSRAHFPNNRYDVMTTNIAESLNSVLMDEREYPVSYIFNSIAKKFCKKFRERYAYVDGKENIFIPCAKKIPRDKKSVSDSLYVTNPNGVLDQYTVFDNALRAKYGDGVGYENSIYEYSSPIYKPASYLLAYSEAIDVVPPEAEWNVPQELLDTKISPAPTIPNSEGSKSNALRASVRRSSPKGGIGVQYARNLGTKEPRLFYGLAEDLRYLERELRRIARFLRAIMERLGMD